MANDETNNHQDSGIPTGASEARAEAKATEGSDDPSIGATVQATAPIRERIKLVRDYAGKHPRSLAAVTLVAVLVGGAEFAVGAVVGVGAGLLFARKTGADLRLELRKYGRDVIDRAPTVAVGLLRRGSGVASGLLKRGRTFVTRAAGPVSPQSGPEGPAGPDSETNKSG